MKVKVSTIVGLTIGGILAVSGAVLMGVGASMASRQDQPTVGDISEYSNVSGLSVQLPECQLKMLCDESAQVCTVTFENMTKLPKVSMEGGTLVIEEKLPAVHHFFDLGLIDKKYGTVTIVLPPKEYGEIELELGISHSSEISGLEAYQVEFEFGAGECTVSDIQVSADMKLECGAGEFTLEQWNVEGDCELDFGVGDIKMYEITCGGRMDLDSGISDLESDQISCRHLDLDCGIGDVKMQRLDLLGDAKIDHGIGNFDLCLNGNADDFGLDCDMGIGNIEFNGRKVGYLEGEHMLRIDGGIGDISITTSEEITR